MFSGKGLCDELITRPEESYRLWCIVVCNLQILKNEEAMTRVGSQRQSGNIYIYIICIWLEYWRGCQQEFVFNIANTAHGMYISCPVPSLSYIHTDNLKDTIRKFNVQY
jgi:hypothetical protein